MVTRCALDTNVLVYAELEPDSEKGARAVRLIEAVGSRGVLAAQTVGEFLTVVWRRRGPEAFVEAQRQAQAYRAVFAVAPTDADTLMAASTFAHRYKLQFWDAVIWQASARAGATILFSEDLQNGFAVDGMRVVDPFAIPDWDWLARLLAA